MTVVRLDRGALRRLDTLAKARRRSRTSIVTEAIANYIAYDKWFVEEVRKGLKEAERGELIDHEEVVKELEAAIASKMDAKRKSKSSVHLRVHS